MINLNDTIIEKDCFNMGLPKYLPRKKKVQYNIRLPEDLLNSLNIYADLTNRTTTDLIINTLTDYMEDKIVFNDYLSTVGSKTIKIPLNADVKDGIIADRYLTTNLLNDFKGNINYYDEINGEVSKPTTIATIEIKRIPNNLDKFDGYTYKFNDTVEHKGIEFFVYTPEEADVIWEYIDYLYCFYFVVGNNQTYVYLIDNLDAINLLANADVTTKDLLIACIKELQSLESIEDYVDGMYSKFLQIAEKYNTGNIVKFGDDIEKRIQINEMETQLAEDPKLTQELLSRIDELETKIKLLENYSENKKK